MNSRTKWLTFSPLGLTLTGLGLSIVGEAGARKGRGAPWFWLGTLGLCCFNAGLSVFAEGVKAKILDESSKFKIQSSE